MKRRMSIDCSESLSAMRVHQSSSAGVSDQLCWFGGCFVCACLGASLKEPPTDVKCRRGKQQLPDEGSIICAMAMSVR